MIVIVKTVRVNEKIRAKEVRLIGLEGDQLGIMPFREALVKAQQAGFDLVEVAGDTSPPVCRIMDYGKYVYEQHKRARGAKKSQKAGDIKEIKIRPKINEHDYQVKLRHLQQFLQAGHKVKLTLMFRGRELSHVDLGKQLLERLLTELQHLGMVEQKARFEGRNIVTIISPLRGTAKKELEGSKTSA